MKSKVDSVFYGYGSTWFKICRWIYDPDQDHPSLPHKNGWALSVANWQWWFPNTIVTTKISRDVVFTENIDKIKRYRTKQYLYDFEVDIIDVRNDNVALENLYSHLGDPNGTKFESYPSNYPHYAGNIGVLSGSNFYREYFFFAQRIREIDEYGIDYVQDPNGALGYPNGDIFYWICSLDGITPITLEPFIKEHWRVGQKLSMNLHSIPYNRLNTGFCTNTIPQEPEWSVWYENELGSIELPLIGSFSFTA